MTYTSEEINEARKFFEANRGTWWFLRSGKPSIHREAVYGYEPTYSID